MACPNSIPHLRRHERHRIQRLRDMTHDKTTFRRCQIVLRAAKGEKPAAIAVDLACDPSTVSRILSAFEQRRGAALPHGKSPGRPRRVTSEQDQMLDQVASQAPRALGKDFFKWTAKKLARHLNLAVHPTTLLRHLWALDWRWRRPVRRVASPDPRYAAKKQYLRRLEREARRRQIRLYYADEVDIFA